VTQQRSTASPPVDAGGDPLTFNVAGLLSQPAGTRREFPIHDVAIDPGDGLQVTRPLEGRVVLTRTNRGLLVEADFRTTLAGECRRCLRPVESAIEIHLEEEALPSIDLTSGHPTQPEEGEDREATHLTDHHELELRPLIGEAIVLAEPMDVLCEPDCPGLCAVCGVRLEPGHAHEEEDVDPRLEVLRAFKVDAPDETG
jgi:uncharacterized protein